MNTTAEKLQQAESSIEKERLLRQEYEGKAGFALAKLDKMLNDAEVLLDRERTLRQEADAKAALLGKKIETDRKAFGDRVTQVKL